MSQEIVNITYVNSIDQPVLVKFSEQGLRGFSGISGWSGVDGTFGTSGESGYSGVSGWSGYSGESGYSGVSAWSGYSGISGFSGAFAGTGTSGYLPLFTGTNSLGNSPLYTDGEKITINSITAPDNDFYYFNSIINITDPLTSSLNQGNYYNELNITSNTTGGYTQPSNFYNVVSVNAPGSYGTQSFPSCIDNNFYALSNFSQVCGIRHNNVPLTGIPSPAPMYTTHDAMYGGLWAYGANSQVRGWRLELSTVNDDGLKQIVYGIKAQFMRLGTSDEAYGYYIDDTINCIGGTQYGVYLNQTSTSTTRYGIYEKGGAINYFKGNVGIDSNAPSEKLHLVGNFRYVDGQQGANKILSSSSTGVAHWVDSSAVLGTSGYSGYSGISGFSSASGLSGFSGISAWSGISGWSGISAWSGTSGYSGISGWSGFSGTSGTSGFSGAAVSTTGTSGYVPYFTSPTDIANSLLYYDSVNGRIGLGTTAPTSLLHLSSPDDTILYARRTGVFDSVQYYRNATAGGGSVQGWNNITTEAGITKGTVTGDVLDTQADFLYAGKTTQFASILMDFGVYASVGAIRLFQYSTGSGGWADLTVTDGTTNFSIDGVITFTPPVDWAVDTVNSAGPYYWVRIGTPVGQPTFSVEPTLYLMVPNTGNEVVYIYANGNDMLPAFGITEYGDTLFGVAGATTNILGTIPTAIITTLTGGTATLSSYITSSIASTLYGSITGLWAQAGTAATAAIPIQSSPTLRFQSRSWNGASTYNAMDIFLKPNAETGNATPRMIWKNGIVNGVTDYSELMTLCSSGCLELLGTTLGAEVFTDPDLDTGATNWTLTPRWTDTTGSFTFVWVSGTATGTIVQTSAKYATPLKANTWYKLQLTIGVAAPTTTTSYIGTEVATEKVYFNQTTTNYPVYFKTNAAPGDFTIYTSSTALSNFRIDAMSLKEVTGGNFHATGTGYFGGNVGIGTTTPSEKLEVNGNIKATGINIVTYEEDVICYEGEVVFYL